MGARRQTPRRTSLAVAVYREPEGPRGDSLKASLLASKWLTDPPTQLPMSAGGGVAAGPRFLKCYDDERARVVLFLVAAGPRFLKCYDRGCAGTRLDQLQLDRDF